MYIFSFSLAYDPTPNPRLLSSVVGIIIHSSVSVWLLTSVVQILKDFVSGILKLVLLREVLNIDSVFANSSHLQIQLKYLPIECKNEYIMHEE